MRIAASITAMASGCLAAWRRKAAYSGSSA
jgi:hypothetical protein